jgi:predicted ATPase
MDGKIFIKTLKLQNFLSYRSETIELQPLNVLIGPNGSGKSNLIEALAVLKATPTDLSSVFRQEGRVDDFLWKGTKWKGTKKNLCAAIEVEVNPPKNSHDLIKIFGDLPGIKSLLYSVSLTSDIKRVNVEDEVVEIHVSSDLIKEKNRTKVDFLDSGQSMLYRYAERDPGSFYLSSQFSKISLYRYWQIARYSELRSPQKTYSATHPLEENGSNLGLFLNNLKKQIGHGKIIENLKKFYDFAEEINIDIEGNTVRLFIREKDLEQPNIYATRLSDGTLRYLFLMALLLDPTPPPLICIEEPEIGLHPDILSTIAEMLIDASKRTQIILTTHSDALVSALSEYPECILVCERDQQGTHLRRLEPDKLKNWLENYTLGDLWRMGEIGGNRW